VLVKNKNLSESLEVALTIIQSQERRIGALCQEVQGLKNHNLFGTLEQSKIESLVASKLAERRALIAEWLWLDEHVYFNYNSMMYRLTYNNGAAFTCSTTGYAGPS
jgi:hypothetical protein